MGKLRTIIVPTNKKAMEELNSGLDYNRANPDGYILWHLSEEEFLNLWNSGVFDSVNHECNALIDDFEDETIEGQKLIKAEKVIEKYNSNALNELIKLREFVKLAVNYGTCIDFAF